MKNVIIPWDFKDMSITLGMCKFVVIDDGGAFQLQASKLPFVFHEDIVNEMRRDGIEGKVIGGGTLFINPRKKTIKACDRAIQYGAAPQAIVEQLLNQYCAEIGYTAIVEMGRY